MVDKWWRGAVIYEVYVRSFADGTGDGEGDLTGLRSRLPYLRELGIDAIWLTPFYPSPLADGGYDVADYRDVDPRFGTLADFDAMLADAHRLGLRVIVDIVPNHSSSAHPWFVEALASPPNSPARERYIFSDTTNDWQSMFGGSAWQRVPDGQYYLHLFDPGQPDFNWRNPEVRAEFESILRFWLDRGVDGFRIDVAHGMIKAVGLPPLGDPPSSGVRTVLPYYDQDEVHDVYRDWRKILDSYPGDRIAVAEAWVTPPTRLARYVVADELHQAFNFDFLEAPWSAPDLRRTIDSCLAAAEAVGAPTTWVLSNHDTHRHVTRYGSLARARAGTLLMLALPGSAYLYQGEELGLPEVLDLPDAARQDPVFGRSGGADKGRAGCRVPIPWSGDTPPYGFSATGAAWLPSPASWGPLTVAAEEGEPGSTLSLYREALRLRRADSMTGPMTWHDSIPTVLDFERRGGLRCVVNAGDEPVPLPRGYGDPVLASGPLAGDRLPADTAAWFTRP
ncbi:MAG TPA: glycoside hydrolase family 13 protein [Rugosimonospora sp.]